MNKHWMIALGILCICTTSLTAKPVINPSLTVEDAAKIVQKHLPTGSKYIGAHTAYDEYEFVFYNDASNECYEVEIDPTTQQITAFKIEHQSDKGSSIATLSEAEVIAMTQKVHPNAVITGFELDYDNGLIQYEVTIEGDTFHGSLTYNPKTGHIIERDYKLTRGKVVHSPGYSTIISSQKATEIVNTQVPGGKIKSIHLDYSKDRGRHIYQIDIIRGTTEHEFEIDAYTGQILEWEKD